MEPTVIEARYMWKQEAHNDRYTFNLLGQPEDADGEGVDVFFHTANGEKFAKGRRYRVTIEAIED